MMHRLRRVEQQEHVAGGESTAYEIVRNDRMQVSQLDDHCRKLKRVSRGNQDEDIKRALGKKIHDLQIGIRRDARWGEVIRSFRLHIADGNRTPVWLTRCTFIVGRIKSESERRYHLIDAAKMQCEEILAVLAEFSSESVRAYIPSESDRRMITRLTLMDPSIGRAMLDRWKARYRRSRERTIHFRKLLPFRERTLSHARLDGTYSFAAIEWSEGQGSNFSADLRRLYSAENPVFSDVESMHQRLDSAIESTSDETYEGLVNRWSRI